MKETKPAHHQVNVVRIEAVNPHPNADKLDIIPVDGYQAISAKGQFKVGDLAYYIQPDSIVPERSEYSFLWGGAVYEGGVPVKKRRVAAKKLRGQWSEGLLMPLTPGMIVNSNRQWRGIVGEDMSEQLGITHYDPPEPGVPQVQYGSKSKYPNSIRGWYHFIKGWLKGERRVPGASLNLPTYDVDNLKKYPDTFVPGELVRVTEKIHGSNARFVFKNGKMWAGSRKLWLAPTSQDMWHRALTDNPWIEKYCRAMPGFALYGEITPTQKGFDYASGEKIRFFLFDIRTPDQTWAEIHSSAYTVSDVEGVPSEAYQILKSDEVPLLYQGPYNEELIRSYVDGKTTIFGAKHIREGVVVKAVPERRVQGLGRAQLKIVSNDYLEKGNKE